METVLILILALAFDLILGEPPLIAHPVAWMGKLAGVLIKIGHKRGSWVQFLVGLITTLMTLAIFVIPVYFALTCLKEFNTVIYIVLGAAVFKISFSLRGLRRTATDIKELLKAGSLDKARFEIRALVGRKTSGLSKELMVSATVESVAENTCDSFVAPLFYFAFLGVPGAIAYRAINTMDAMIGHHGEFEYLGKFVARLDTIVNFIPARITALLIVLVSWIIKYDASNAWRIMNRDWKKTESPNAGLIMGAIAGALNVRLEKKGFYILGNDGNTLSTEKIDDSIRIISFTAAAWFFLLIIFEVIYHVAT